MKNMLAELLIETWAMEPKHLEKLIQFFRSRADLFSTTKIGGAAEPAAIFGEDAPKRSRMTVAGGVARIPISGVLLKRVPSWLRWFGVDATSYSDIQDDVQAALADEGVKEIVLAVDSPGGQVAGVHEAGEAILAARGKGKRITAEVQDLCASAAYWLASQAHSITAGPNAQVGSIGVYSVYVDSSEAAKEEGFKVHVISSGPHKGAGVPGAPITAEQLAGFQKVIDGMAANFKDAVARGRSKYSRKDVDGWATGQVWLAAEAASMGLIDGVGNHRNAGAAEGRPAATDTKQETKEEIMAADPNVAGAERKPATAAELMAAFPKHPAFALAQAAKCAPLLEAKAAFNEVLQAEADAAAAGQADAEKRLSDVQKAPKPAPGVAAVPTGGAPEAHAGKDFMALAKESAHEHQKVCLARMNHKGEGQPECCTVTAAMSRLSAEQPELHKKYLEASAPRVADRKKALGWK